MSALFIERVKVAVARVAGSSNATSAKQSRARLLELLKEALSRFEIAVRVFELEVRAKDKLAAPAPRDIPLLSNETVGHGGAIVRHSEAFDEVLGSARRKARPSHLIGEVRCVDDEHLVLPVPDGMPLHEPLLR